MASTTVREKPILFSGPMVRALLDGRKTMTRRVVKPQPYVNGRQVIGGPTMSGYVDDGLYWQWENPKLDAGYCHTNRSAMERLMLSVSPYQVGSRLWVREAWAPSAVSGYRQIAYAADGRWGSPNGDRGIVFHGWITGVTDKAVSDWQERRGHWVGRTYFEHWRSPIHMPRNCSRITLEITEVRVERVQEISYDDAAAEGVEAWEGFRGCPGCVAGECDGPRRVPGRCETFMLGYKESFKKLWDRLNKAGGYGWETNCWCWVISFERVEP